MKYTVFIEKAPNNYAAYAPNVPGSIATGKTIEDVTRNIRDALELHFEVGQERGESIPESTTLATVVEVAVPIPA